mmetsp:Transcript_2089/g.13493  ORF Transcript_2089/g.13493 Transcript_2089/m.13493 type:complete len:215 (-) Transcript_2089:4369-5013(-)
MHPIGIFDGGNDPLASKDARWRRFLSCRSRHDCPNGFHSRRSLLSQFVHTHTQHFLPFHWSLVDRFAPTQCLSGSIQHVSLQAIVRLLLRPLQSTPSFRQSRQVVRPTRNTSCASHRGRRVHPSTRASQHGFDVCRRASSRTLLGKNGRRGARFHSSQRARSCGAHEARRGGRRSHWEEEANRGKEKKKSFFLGERTRHGLVGASSADVAWTSP